MRNAFKIPAVLLCLAHTVAQDHADFAVNPAAHGAPWYPECWAEVRRIPVEHE